jgi:tetratricopeptide (TPR) repeat protein
MLVKAIFKVNLQFGNPRSYEQAMKTFNHKLENLYKGEACIKHESFDEATFSLSVPNLVVTTLEKTIKNTAYILDDLAKFASSGKGYCWIINEGKASFAHFSEPTESKSVILSFLKGRQLAKEAGREQEAIQELTAAVEKFDAHWTAFERRGYIYGLIGEFDKAIADFNSSIATNPFQADSYFSRARVNMLKKDYNSAIEDFDTTWKNANPQMPLYWSARRVKAECCLIQGKYAEAAQELKFFTKQKFAEENANYPWRKSAWLNYSRALHEIKMEKEAKEAFKTAFAIKDNLEPIIEGDLLKFCNLMSARCGVKIPSETSSDMLVIA